MTQPYEHALDWARSSPLLPPFAAAAAAASPPQCLDDPLLLVRAWNTHACMKHTCLYRQYPHLWYTHSKQCTSMCLAQQISLHLFECVRACAWLCRSSQLCCLNVHLKKHRQCAATLYVSHPFACVYNSTHTQPHTHIHTHVLQQSTRCSAWLFLQ